MLSAYGIYFDPGSACNLSKQTKRYTCKISDPGGTLPRLQRSVLIPEFPTSHRKVRLSIEATPITETNASNGTDEHTASALPAQRYPCGGPSAVDAGAQFRSFLSDESMSSSTLFFPVHWIWVPRNLVLLRFLTVHLTRILLNFLL
jgi:hypothetical protein